MRMTIDLNQDQLAALDAAAAATGQGREELIQEAISRLGDAEYLDILRGIARGMEDFRQGRIAADGEVNALFHKYGVR